MFRQKPSPLQVFLKWSLVGFLLGLGVFGIPILEPGAVAIQPRLPLAGILRSLHHLGEQLHPAPLPPAPEVEADPTRFVAPESLRGKVVAGVSVKPSEKVIALTFDDGPWDSTPQVLKILQKYQVTATFFWIGQHVQNHPEIAQQVVAGGYAIGNHTWSHHYGQVNDQTAATEIQNTGALIHRMTGVSTLLFRPPGGHLNNGLADYARKHGYTVIMWSVDPRDSEPQTAAAAIVRTVLSQVRPGAIVLLHDGGGDRRATIQALPEILKGLKDQGYHLVTVPELLKFQNPVAGASGVVPF